MVFGKGWPISCAMCIWMISSALTFVKIFRWIGCCLKSAATVYSKWSTCGVWLIFVSSLVQSPVTLRKWIRDWNSLLQARSSKWSIDIAWDTINFCFIPPKSFDLSYFLWISDVSRCSYGFGVYAPLLFRLYNNSNNNFPTSHATPPV